MQAIKEKWQQSQTRIQEGTQSLVILLDMAFNKGKNINQMLPKSFEDAIEMQQNAQKAASVFINKTWWKPD
jgi:hypothetical protein